jgi:glycosyltransferase involved in cell wall biosynthesis
MTRESYVLVTAARNEEAFIDKTIESIVSQTVLPRAWMIVSDGSTDGTDEIVRRYVGSNGFIRLIRLSSDNGRTFASQVFAQRAGIEQLGNSAYDYVGFLDADVSLEHDCLERILEKFSYNPKLGVAGGAFFEMQEGQFRSCPGNRSRCVGGALQIFRRECFEQIDYIALRSGGQDTIAEAWARMNGWEVKSFPELYVYHHRAMGACSSSLLKTMFRFGQRDYDCCTYPVYEMAKCVRRLGQRPYVVGSFLRMIGYCWAYLRRYKRQVPDDLAEFIRREQRQRLYKAVLKRDS